MKFTQTSLAHTLTVYRSNSCVQGSAHTVDSLLNVHKLNILLNQQPISHNISSTQQLPSSNLHHPSMAIIYLISNSIDHLALLIFIPYLVICCTVFPFVSCTFHSICKIIHIFVSHFLLVTKLGKTP